MLGILIIAALVVAIMSAMTPARAPLWVAVVLLCIAVGMLAFGSGVATLK
jgi:hypothetical protein